MAGNIELPDRYQIGGTLNFRYSAGLCGITSHFMAQPWRQACQEWYISIYWIRLSCAMFRKILLWGPTVRRLPDISALYKDIKQRKQPEKLCSKRHAHFHIHLHTHTHTLAGTHTGRETKESHFIFYTMVKHIRFSSLSLVFWHKITEHCQIDLFSHLQC